MVKKKKAAKRKPVATSKKSKAKASKKVVKKTVVKKKKAKTKGKVKAKRKAKVTATPKGYSSVTPYLVVANATQAIEFYKKVFDAKELMRMEKPGGKIAHAELKLGDSKIMLGDECPEMNAHSPKAYGGCAVGIHLYVKDVDAVLARAVKAGAKLSRPAEDMFYGDRIGSVECPYGHKWSVATHIEDVSPAQLKKRASELYNQHQ